MEIFFSVGEPSGDQHAAHLIEEIQQRRPDIRCTGFGGPEMKRAGCELLFQLTDLAVMGFLSVVPMLRKFFREAKRAEEYFAEHKPDAVVLVDFPGFNWAIAKRAKAAGIPVFYFLPPQLWAWAPWRIKKVRKYVDHLLCGLSFEPEWYAQRGIEVDFVGHPFFDEVAAKQLDEEFCREQQRSAEKIVGILPGSRNHEVKANFADQLQLIDGWSRRHPEAKFLVASYKESQRAYCEALVQKWERPLPIEFHVDKTSEIIEISDCCAMVSGSVSLELLARTKPAIVMYKGGFGVWLIGKTIMTIDYISLPNLFAKRAVFPEFYHLWDLGKDMRGMHETVDRWLSDPAALQAKKDELEALKLKTVSYGAIAKTATVILEKLVPQSLTRAA